MSGNTQKMVGKVRKPRVHLTYDVETGDAQVKREIPFVIGVMGDFSGDPARSLPRFSDRGFVTIDRDNFDKVMAGMTPGLKLQVANKLKEDGGDLPVDLAFKSMADFEPANVARQVPALADLIETRAQLRELAAKAIPSRELEEALKKILKDDAFRDALSKDPRLSDKKD